ncbi:hypothetical protein C8A00DRAFT_14564 [Chaetomidium leptoderma]|uniref:RING-type E3 ubiquitin transferase n=1 Tax=Chaetomidium leptoderma TaxID=669021 RepID=A0AAN6ZXB2_9PEZI|nr:hypothetical protein C8A00DRAFT_14564 [Chaetomidium leptoderma]
MDTGGEADGLDDIQAQVLQTTLAEIETDSAEAHDCCVICLDSVSDPCAALPCGHAHFDFVCLVSWLQEHPNCPLCKANVYKVRYTDAQTGEAFYRVSNAPRTRDSTGRDDGEAGQSGPPPYADSPSRPRFTSQNGLLRDTRRRYPRPPPFPNEAIQRRRHIYRHQLYSLHIGSNRISQYRPPPTPIQFSSTPHLISRARLWIRRELQVFSFLSDPDPDTTTDPTSSSSSTPTPARNMNTNPTKDDQIHRRRTNNAEFLLEYIIAILKTVDVQGSTGQAETMLSDFLGREHARLFLHELRSWLRSPAASLAAWDRDVQYSDPDPGPDPNISSLGRRRRSRGETEIEEGGGEGEGGGPPDGAVEGRGGRSWRDRGGDHWRADGGGTYSAGDGGAKRKMRRGEGGDGAAGEEEGRVRRQRRG